MRPGLRRTIDRSGSLFGRSLNMPVVVSTIALVFAPVFAVVVPPIVPPRVRLHMPVPRRHLRCALRSRSPIPIRARLIAFGRDRNIARHYPYATIEVGRALVEG